MSTQVVTHEEVLATQRWLTELGRDYRGEVPTRIHASFHGQHYGLGAAPPFAPEFISYIGRINCSDPKCRQCADDLPIYSEAMEARRRNPESKTRVTRAFRKLRRAAPLEFDVLYLAVMQGLTVQEIAERLTQRAIKGGHEDRYDAQAVVVLAVVGMEKIGQWM